MCSFYRRSSATPLSAAGQRLASSLRAAGRTPAGAPSGAADKQLRASYRTQTPGTPSAGRGGAGSRADGAPAVIDREEAARLAKLRAAALHNKQRLAEGMAPESGKLTDDLLNI